MPNPALGEGRLTVDWTPPIPVQVEARLNGNEGWIVMEYPVPGGLTRDHFPLEALPMNHGVKLWYVRCVGCKRKGWVLFFGRNGLLRCARCHRIKWHANGSSQGKSPGELRDLLRNAHTRRQKRRALRLFYEWVAAFQRVVTRRYIYRIGKNAKRFRTS